MISMIVFDKKANRFRDETGRFISLGTVRGEIKKLEASVREEMRDLGKRLSENLITITAWQTEMSGLVKSAVILAVAISFGGLRQMNKLRWKRIRESVKEQNKYLNNFAGQIKRGQVSDVQIINRSGLYAVQARVGYYEVEQETSTAKLCKRVLNSGESCSDCAEWAEKGFVPIDTQPPIGSLICRNWCLCEIEYK